MACKSALTYVNKAKVADFALNQIYIMFSIYLSNGILIH